ncbi:hypothetical protein [Blastopirellula marina]|uniref:Type I restriction endonuclease subunit M n=1 Tax=Blastopirellula marina TaxID=124 RepID=A0A2S8FD70_9BACT|nr:hypothetical protein [Blastopirellula marina]PQO30113.1 hypothetical protein C5Y98_21420 [Blastopirellula marina]PTL42551.1 hypothetical protein C5Y97_21430 [Blastopirellula marina]
MPSAKFDLRQIVATPGALEVLKIAGQNPTEFLTRHAAGDWGEVCDEDKQANEDALKTGARLLSAYTALDERILIITEAADEDGRRAATTILLVSEY